jgi:hypothetical protein
VDLVFQVDADTAKEVHRMPTPQTLPTIQIRHARPDDEPTLLRLAALDSAPAPRTDDVLLALVDGEILAALDLTSARAIADPFRPTADLVELLRTRAQLLGVRGSTDRRKRLSLRRAPRIVLAR